MCAAVAGQARPVGAGAGAGDGNRPRRSASPAAGAAISPIFTPRRRIFSRDNPQFCRSALSGYTQHDFIALVETYGIAWHEKTRGQLFCDGSSRQIIDMLLEECRSVRNCASAFASRRSRKARRALSLRRIKASFAAARWWSRPAARRFRKWARADSATGRRTIRPQDRAAARGAGAAHLRCGHAGAVQGSVRHLGRCRRELRQDRVSTRRCCSPIAA